MSAGPLRATRNWLAGLAAGLLFFSQIASAAQACNFAMAGSLASSVQVMSDEGCDGMPMDAAVCRVRCLSQDQSAAAPDQPWQAVTVIGPVQHAAIMPIAARCPSQSVSEARPPGGPPLRILYCSFQI